MTTLPETMKALRVSKAGSVELVSVPVPRPVAGELLVKIRASAVQPSDILNSKGSFHETTFPRIPGRDFAGVVVEGPSQWKGKEVFGTSGSSFSFTRDGAHAEYAVVRIDGLAVKPPQLSWVQAATVGVPCTTALQILKRSKPQSGESVAVLGASGAVGSWVVKLAVAKSCHTISVGRHGTDIISTSDPRLEGISALTNDKGVDVAVDTVGDLALAKAAIQMLAVRGRFCTISAPRSGSTELTVDILLFYRKQLSLLGCNSIDATQSEMASLLNDELLPLIAEGKVEAPEAAHTPIQLEQAVEAYAARIKKAVIVFE